MLKYKVSFGKKSHIARMPEMLCSKEQMEQKKITWLLLLHCLDICLEESCLHFVVNFRHLAFSLKSFVPYLPYSPFPILSSYTTIAIIIVPLLFCYLLIYTVNIFMKKFLVQTTY